MRAIADAMADTLKEVVEPFLTEPEKPEIKPGDHLEKPNAWDWEEGREIRRAQEREAASRFRQYRAGKNRRAVKKRTGARRREWRGPWKGR